MMRVIGIDLGERRIGVAVSDASGTLARPLKTIERGSSDAEAVERLNAMIEELATEDEVGSVVVGLPMRLDGSPSRQTERVGIDGDAALGAADGSGLHLRRAVVEP